MIDIVATTLTEAFYLGMGLGSILGFAVGFVLAFLAMLWVHSGRV